MLFYYINKNQDANWKVSRKLEAIKVPSKHYDRLQVI